MLSVQSNAGTFKRFKMTGTALLVQCENVNDDFQKIGLDWQPVGERKKPDHDPVRHTGFSG